MTNPPDSPEPQASSAAKHTGQGADGHAPESYENATVKMTPLLWTLGILALIIGIGAGLVMSQATLFR